MVMRIKALREAQGLSQKQLAVSMGYVQSAVANWESEVVLPRSRDLPALARVLDCEINDLFVSECEEVS